MDPRRHRVRFLRRGPQRGAVQPRASGMPGSPPRLAARRTPRGSGPLLGWWLVASSLPVLVFALAAVVCSEQSTTPMRYARRSQDRRQLHRARMQAPDSTTPTSRNDRTTLWHRRRNVRTSTGAATGALRNEQIVGALSYASAALRASRPRSSRQRRQDRQRSCRSAERLLASDVVWADLFEPSKPGTKMASAARSRRTRRERRLVTAPRWRHPGRLPGARLARPECTGRTSSRRVARALTLPGVEHGRRRRRRSTSLLTTEATIRRSDRSLTIEGRRRRKDRKRKSSHRRGRRRPSPSRNRPSFAD